MLLDITRLPKAIGPLSNRPLLVFDKKYISSLNHSFHPNTIKWPYFSFKQSPCLFGSDIDKPLNNLFKLTYLSYDGSCLIEYVVIEETHYLVRPLYVKLISRSTINLFISLATINAYQQRAVSLIPFYHLLSDQTLDYVNLNPAGINGSLDYFIHPIFGEENLKRHLFRVQDVYNEYGIPYHRDVNKVHQHLYSYAPHIVDAFISGQLAQNPLSQIPTSYIHLPKTQEKFSLYETALYQSQVRHQELIINHKDLDDVVLNLMSLLPTDIAFTYRLTGDEDDISLIKEFSILHTFNNPYAALLNISFDKRPEHFSYYVLKQLEFIFTKIMYFYTRDQNFSIDSWSGLRPNISSITIRKNAQDEVMISICDHVHNREIIYYSYFPLIALGTLGAGS